MTVCRNLHAGEQSVRYAAHRGQNNDGTRVAVRTDDVPHALESVFIGDGCAAKLHDYRAHVHSSRSIKAVPPAVAGGSEQQYNPPATAGGTDLLTRSIAKRSVME